MTQKDQRRNQPSGRKTLNKSEVANFDPTRVQPAFDSYNPTHIKYGSVTGHTSFTGRKIGQVRVNLHNPFKCLVFQEGLSIGPYLTICLWGDLHGGLFHKEGSLTGKSSLCCKNTKETTIRKRSRRKYQLRAALASSSCTLVLCSATGYAGQVGLKLADPLLKWVV